MLKTSGGSIIVFALIILLASNVVQASQATTSNKKVDAFMSKISRATSIEEMSQAFMRANFSTAEREQIKKKLRSSPYKQKVERLITSSHKKGRVIKKTYRQQKPKETKPRASVQSMLSRARSADKQKQRRLSRNLKVTKGPQISSIKTHFGSGSGPVAAITRVSPQSGAAGTVVTITGTNFGPRGRVAVIVEKALGGDNGMAYAEIRSWSPKRIVATLPDSIQSLIGEEEKSGIIWVKMAESELGPYANFRFTPNSSMAVPIISEVNPNPIYLDSDILITGSNFLTSRKPTVKARAGTVEVTLNVTEWSDTYIFVSSGSDFHSTLARIPSGGFFLSVENHLGGKATKSVTLARRMIRRTISYGLAHRVQCEVWNTSRDRPSVFCWAGYKKTFRQPYSRCTGWSVVGYTVRILDQGCCSGYSFKKEPFGNDPSYEIELWANAFGHIELEVDVEMEGPEGTGCW